MTSLINFPSVVYSFSMISDNPKPVLWLVIIPEILDSCFASTFTLTVSVFPFDVVTVIVVVPTPVAIQLPSLSIVMISGFPLTKFKLLSVVFSGWNVMANLPVSPTIWFNSFGSTVILSAGISFAVTVTLTVAVFPFDVVTSIVVVPTPVAIQLPSLSIVMISGFPLTKFKLLSVVLPGWNVMASFPVSPTT